MHCPGITIEDVRKSDLLAELTDILSECVSQDLWLLSYGIDNNPWGQYQPLIPDVQWYGLVLVVLNICTVLLEVSYVALSFCTLYESVFSCH